MLKLVILLVLTTTVLSKYRSSNQIAWWDTDDNKESDESSENNIPFPQCLMSGSRSRYFDLTSWQKVFERKLYEAQKDLQKERYENYKHDNYGIMDNDADQLRNENSKSRVAASAAVKLATKIMTTLACNLSHTDAEDINKFLSDFKIPEEFCTFRENPDCSTQRDFRTITGVCNNLKHPYQGSSQTAFGRLLPARYDDNLSKPRRKSSCGGSLPPCRRISLAMGSRPLFDRNYNNFFVIWGQFMAHDMSLATPVSDTYLAPISSCGCGSKYDWNKCNVIDVQSDDPHLRGQKCMAFPATAQAFKDQKCSLGVKEQMNTNTHHFDLSTVYGNTLRTAEALRGDNGLLKTMKRYWSKYDLPPAQREGKSCVDANEKRSCFAGGDSRLMENLLFTGIHTIFLRFHNELAKIAATKFPSATSDQIYEKVRSLAIDVHQLISYGAWIPQLLGPQHGKSLADVLTQINYNPDTPAVVYNEVATAAFRLHTLVRDLFSRCTSDGKRIDQLWLHDISHKAKYAYDMENNGVDSIICGSLYDYGFASDGNFAYQIHHRLFESTSKYGQLWRNDLVAINICRGREHGIASYNEYREFCHLKKADRFEDFGDSINYDGIKLLKKLYKCPDAVDLFVGLNLEDPVEGGIVGPTSACLLERQFQALCEGDRFCALRTCGVTQQKLSDWSRYLLSFIICVTVNIEEVPLFPFKPPNNNDNPLVKCSAFDEWETKIFPATNDPTPFHCSTNGGTSVQPDRPVIELTGATVVQAQMFEITYFANAVVDMAKRGFGQ